MRGEDTPGYEDPVGSGLSRSEAARTKCQGHGEYDSLVHRQLECHGNDPMTTTYR